MARLKVGVLISGRGSNLQALIKAVGTPGYPAKIVLVVSNRPGAAGLSRATAAGIDTMTIDHTAFENRRSFEQAIDAELRKAGVDLICLAGFMRLLTPEFVDNWRDRLINIHPSLLPSFRGADPHKQAIAAGVRISGCTVHFVRPEMDSGPIILQSAVPVLQDDTVATLAARVLDAEHRCYPLAVRLFAEQRLQIYNGCVRIDGGNTIISETSGPPVCEGRI